MDENLKKKNNNKYKYCKIYKIVKMEKKTTQLGTKLKNNNYNNK
jgi:hypothetical protein